MKNPPSKALIAYRKMKASPARESLRLQGIKALGISLANSRTDIDPSQYSFTHRGFIGSANDNAPRSRDIAVFERMYPDYTWAEAQAFSRAHSHIMYLRVKEAMDRAHGEGWADRAYRNNPASYRSTAPAAKSFNARDRHPYWALSRWVSSDMKDKASEQTLAKAIGQSRVNAARAGILSEMDLEEVVYRKYGSPAPLSNPYTWQQEESRKAVLKALQTRDPEDVKKARALQARNERMALGQRSNPLGSRIAVPVGSGLIIGDQLVNPRRKRRPGAPARKPFQAQAFLFDRQHWTEARARQWLKKNGHKIGEVSLTDEYIKFKHWSPYDYQKGTLHDVLVAENVVATVGIPKSNSDAIDAPGYNKRGPRRQARLFTRGASDDYVFAGDPDDILW